MKKMNRGSAISAAFLLLAAGTATASTLNVPGQYATVGAALTAASAGDSILVAGGTYAPSTNGESFPLAITQDVALIGAGQGLSVLDAEGTATVISCTAPAGIRISGFTITGGVAVLGGGILVDSGTPEIDHNLIIDNGAELRGAGVFVRNASVPWVHHNVVWDNYDTIPDEPDPHGIVIAHTAAGIFEHNLIGRTDGNGLLTSGDSSPSVRHNLFLENGETVPAVRGRGICWFSSVSPPVFHNLFWANEVAAILWPAGGSNLSGAQANAFSPTDSVFGNLDADPALVDPDNLDFHLTAGSPAIDAGVPTYPPDPDGTIPDIGPFYFPQTGTSAPLVASAGTIISLAGAPNPFSAGTSVRFALDHRSRTRVELIDVRGRHVRTLHDGDLPAGSHAFSWDGRDERGAPVASGVYLASLTADGERRTTPLVRLR